LTGVRFFASREEECEVLEECSFSSWRELNVVVTREESVRGFHCITTKKIVVNNVLIINDEKYKKSMTQ
jgi:hypothetical protein